MVYFLLCFCCSASYVSTLTYILLSGLSGGKCFLGRGCRYECQCGKGCNRVGLFLPGRGPCRMVYHVWEYG